MRSPDTFKMDPLQHSTYGQPPEATGNCRNPATASDIRFDDGEIHHAACQVCGGRISLAFEKASAFGTFGIVRCAKCKFAFVNPTPKLATLVEFYSRPGHGEEPVTSLEAVLAIEKDDPNTILDAQRIVTRLWRAAPGTRFLDVGCGHGLFSAEARRQGFHVGAIEIAEVERNIAASLLGFAPAAVTFEQFRPDGRYDAVIMSQVLEHAREPVKWLEKLRGLLSDGGVAAIAVPNFNSFITDILRANDPYVIPPIHLNFFGPGNLARMAEAAGLKVVQVETLTRVLKRAFTRRFGRAPGLAAHKAFSTGARLLDPSRKGVMLNVYVQRT